MSIPQVLLNAPTINVVAPRPENHHQLENLLEPWVTTETVLLHLDSLDRNDSYTVGLYVNWLRYQTSSFLLPNLAGFRDYLLEKRQLKPTTVSKYLTCIRKRYERLVRDRDLLFNMVQKDLSFLERKALVDEIVARIENAINPKVIAVRYEVVQDMPDEIGVRLTRDQATLLLSQPGLDSLLGVRNTAMIALALSTGVREGELTKLEVRDLRQKLNGELALHIRLGKGRKTRLIPFGPMVWALDFVDAGLRRALSSRDTFSGVLIGLRLKKLTR